MDAPVEIVAVGCHVELELVSEEAVERLELFLVPDAQADYYGGYLGENTALAKAILGQTAGAEVVLSDEEPVMIKILAVQPAGEVLAEAKENAVRRKQAVDKARRQIDRTNAIIFSSTVEGKWGEYDTDGIDDW